MHGSDPHGRDKSIPPTPRGFFQVWFSTLYTYGILDRVSPMLVLKGFELDSVSSMYGIILGVGLCAKLACARGGGGGPPV